MVLAALLLLAAAVASLASVVEGVARAEELAAAVGVEVRCPSK